MPLMRCNENGKPGWKWGENGKCYTGPDAKEKALAQRRAIEANKDKGIEDEFLNKINKLAEEES